MNITKINSKMERLEGLLKQATESLIDAGKLVVEMIREDPKNYDLIKEKFGFNDHVMEKMQNVGLGRMLPEFVLSSSPAAKYAERLTIEDQKKIVERGVAIVRSVEGGKISTEVVDYRKLKDAECRQVFEGKSLVTVEKQAERVKQKLVVMPPPEKRPYNIAGELVHFNQDVTLGLLELEAIVEHLKKVAIESLATPKKQASK